MYVLRPRRCFAWTCLGCCYIDVVVVVVDLTDAVVDLRLVIEVVVRA